jgi:hypothetical protein
LFRLGCCFLVGPLTPSAGKYMNDQSALLWTEGGRTWFWGGGGGELDFKVAVSDDSVRRGRYSPVCASGAAR